MDTQRHEVIHLIVRIGDVGEDAGDALLFLRLGDGLIAEMCALARRVLGVLVLTDTAGE